jgi:hypothetical protein
MCRYLIHFARISFLFFLVSVCLFSCKKEPVENVDGNDKDPTDTTEVENYSELEFSILCYNVAGLPQLVSSSDPERFMTSISPLLNDYDIVHVQEDFHYHDSLLLFNTHPYKTDPMPTIPNGDGLNTFSNFPISNLDRVPWTDCTGFDCGTPKGFSYSQITFPDGIVVDFYNVHCNAGSDVESLEARRGNIRQLSNYIEENSANKPVLLFGDFNCRYTRSGDSIRAILDLGFKDAWIETNRNGDIPTANDNSLTDCDPDRNSFTCEVVDKIFYRGTDFLEISVLSYQTDHPDFYFEGNDTLDLSDHWPLLADIKFVSKISIIE